MNKSILLTIIALNLNVLMMPTAMAITLPFKFAKPTNPQEMLNLINQARSQARKCGSQYMPAVQPLKWNLILERTAQAHANDMAQNNYFQHNSKDGRTSHDRMQQAGYTMQKRLFMTAENIAAGDESASQVIESWLSSPEHCKNLMTPELTEVGMAVASKMGTEYTNYWVQHFGTR